MSSIVRLPTYLSALRDYLESDEAELWEWFRSTRETEAAAKSLRLELLKSTYRLERDDRKELYALADAVSRELGLECAITLYRAQNAEGHNVSLSYAPGEAHVVFQGPVQDVLSAEEMRAVLAHELSHYLLYEGWDGDLFVAHQILKAMASDVAADPSHFATLRLFSLYAEIFCDRGAFHVAGAALPVIGALLKVETGEREVNPESYLRQADEIFSQEEASSRGVTHPETFIRTRALQLFMAEEAAKTKPEVTEAAIRNLVEGPPRFDGLDLLGRKRVEALTRSILERISKPTWLRTDAVLAHARQFFDDFSPSDAEDAADADETLAKELAKADDTLLDYYSFVLLDFVAVEQEHDEAPLAAALTLAQRLGLEERVREKAKKELKLKKRDIDRVFKEAESILAAAQRSKA